MKSGAHSWWGPLECQIRQCVTNYSTVRHSPQELCEKVQVLVQEVQAGLLVAI